MRGFLYRWAIRLKDFGERHNLVVFIKMGLALRERLDRRHFDTFYGLDRINS